MLKDEINTYKHILQKFIIKYKNISYYKFKESLPENNFIYFHDGYHLLPEGRKYFKNYMIRGLSLAAGYIE